jgi:hypothetical protein
VTSTSSEKSMRLYNGRGAYNEWTFVAVQRNLNAGAGAQGAAAPGTTGRGGRGAQTPGGGRGTQQPGESPFRPAGGAQRPGAGTFGR